jgi:hypothetical protein
MADIEVRHFGLTTEATKHPSADDLLIHKVLFPSRTDEMKHLDNVAFFHCAAMFVACLSHDPSILKGFDFIRRIPPHSFGWAQRWAA